MALRAWSRPKNSVSFKSSSRIFELKASQIPFCIGLPRAMKCQGTPVSSLQASIAFEVNSVPWSLTIKPGLPRRAISAISSRATRRPEIEVSTTAAKHSFVTSSITLKIDLARRHGLTISDSLYLELALRKGAALATLDGKRRLDRTFQALT